MRHTYFDSKNQRQCGDCTACCEGWLTGESHGHEFFPGQPCFYLCKTGCSIYEKRPEDPCKTYKCAWLTEDNVFPEWMKPSESKVICTIREWIDKNDNSEFFFQFIPTGKEISGKVYHWIMKFHYNTKIPVTVQFYEDLGIYGSDDFIDYITRM